MHKAVIIYLIINCWAVSALGQPVMSPSVVAAGGNYHTGDNISISWTLGDLAVSTLTGENLVLTQGFHQPALTGTGMAIKKFQGNILVYPNPVKDELYIRFKTLSRCDYLIEIQDMTGRILMQQTCKQVAPDDIIRINSLPYAPGIYFLKINDSGNEAPFVISIRKVL